VHYILQYSFCFVFESEKHVSLYWYLEKTQGHRIGPLPWSRYANSTTNHNRVSIYCARLTPQWKQSIRSSSMQAWETWSLKCSITRPYRQSRKFPPILIITEAKNAYFFVCKPTGFVHQELRDFVKRTLTRVSSHWLWLESSHYVKNVTRVESTQHFSQRDSSSSHQKSWLDTRVTLSLRSVVANPGQIHKIGWDVWTQHPKTPKSFTNFKSPKIL